MHPMNQICKEDKKIVWVPKLTKISTFHQSQEDVFLTLSIDILQGILAAVLMFSRPEISKHSTSCLN